MGKGSNVQKAQAARERNAKSMGRTPEERSAAAAKVAKDSAAFCCSICRQTFMINVQPVLLHSHCVAKHAGVSPASCFSVLAGFDPNAPEPVKVAAVVKKVVKKADVGLDDLLNAGLKKGKK